MDISWEQQVPTIQPDDIDRNLLYNQYPYQKGDDYDDEEEEMEVDGQMPGPSGDVSMAAPTSLHPYQCLPGSYATYAQQALDSPRSIHTNTDAAMEFDTLKVTARAALPPGLAKELSAPDLVNHLTKVMASTATGVIDGLTRPPPVTDTTDTTLRERFMQRRATATQHSNTNPPFTAGQVTVWD